jgi:hypothetical protein
MYGHEEKSMSLDKALNEVTQNVPDCLAAGFVDINSGMLLGIKTVDSHPREVIELLAAASGDLFQGSNVVTIERLFKRARGLPESDDEHYFQEIIVLSKNLIHVFVRGKTLQDQVLVTVCRANANLGMVLTKTRLALSTVEAAA